MAIYYLYHCMFERFDLPLRLILQGITVKALTQVLETLNIGLLKSVETVIDYGIFLIWIECISAF